MWTHDTKWNRDHSKSLLLIPQTDLHSWGVLAPCCPARFVSVRGCWRRTGPGCTGGPAASPGLSRAPSSGPWPSALCGCVWSDPSLQRGMPWTALCRKELTRSHRLVKNTIESITKKIQAGAVFLHILLMYAIPSWPCHYLQSCWWWRGTPGSVNCRTAPRRRSAGLQQWWSGQTKEQREGGWIKKKDKQGLKGKIEWLMRSTKWKEGKNRSTGNSLCIDQSPVRANGKLDGILLLR